MSAETEAGDSRLTAALDGQTRAALARLWSLLPEARLVGGAVRDLLAGRPVSDIDLATPEPPERVEAILRADGIKVVATGLAHGTITAVLDRRPFEITTLREDLDTDGRHARVAWTADWRADAARRDFTINAMSLGRDGDLHDYFDGAADLRDGIVRFVGDAGRRIEEDALRILRFFRFQARYGSGRPDPDAIAAMTDRLGLLDRLSAERVWSELSRLLSGPEPGRILALMQASGVLTRLLPDAQVARVEALDRIGAPPDAILRLAALIETGIADRDVGRAEAVSQQLRLSRNDARLLAAYLGQGRADAVPTDPASLRRRLADDPADVVIGRSWLHGEPDETRAALSAQQRPVFPLTGRDAAAAGLQPGPGMGAALASARDWWMQGGCVADRAACLERLRMAASESR